MTEYREVSTTRRNTGQEFHTLAYKLAQLVWLFFIILEVLLALRIGLKLIGANPGSFFTALVYAVTDIFLFPFAGIVASPSIGNMVIEISTFIAMVVYILIGWVIDRLIYQIFYWPTTRTTRRTVVAEREPADTNTVVEVHNQTPPANQI